MIDIPGCTHSNQVDNAKQFIFQEHIIYGLGVTSDVDTI